LKDALIQKGLRRDVYRKDWFFSPSHHYSVERCPNLKGIATCIGYLYFPKKDYHHKQLKDALI